MIADELNKLKQTKASIKLALIDKGQNPTDEFASYATDIRAIETGGGGSEFSLIGYDKNPNYITEGILYAKEIQDNWVVNNSYPTKTKNFSNNLKLIFFPIVDTDYYKLNFDNCSNLLYLPLINTSKINSLSYTFANCTSLLEIDCISDWDTSNVETCFGAFKNTGLSSLDLSKWNLDKCTNMQSMFSDSINLESVKLPDNMPKLLGIGLQETFENCKSLKSVNIPSTTLEISISHLFNGCKSLESVDLTPLESAKIKELTSLFNNCESLKQFYFPNLDISLAKNMNTVFSNCSSLEIIDFSLLDTSKITSFSSIFSLCKSLYKVTNLDVTSLTGSISDTYFTSYNTNNSLRYLLLKNLGKNEGLKSFSVAYILNWGDESNITQYPLSEGSKQSLVDSLITYSFDRATAGYSTCTIKLYTNTKALLTEDEIALITAKGYTIA